MRACVNTYLPTLSIMTYLWLITFFAKFIFITTPEFDYCTPKPIQSRNLYNRTCSPKDIKKLKQYAMILSCHG